MKQVTLINSISLVYLIPNVQCMATHLYSTLFRCAALDFYLLAIHQGNDVPNTLVRKPLLPSIWTQKRSLASPGLILSSQISQWLHGQLKVLSPLQQIPLALVKGPKAGSLAHP